MNNKIQAEIHHLCATFLVSLKSMISENINDKLESDSCHKLSYGLPTLSPGSFTTYCQHRLCYGFEVMAQCKSPKIPFQVFTTRIRHPPHVIVNDNVCRLHLYFLKHEPQHFMDSLFLVDHFHWRGHYACSSGYNLDAYSGLHLIDVNSQINGRQMPTFKRFVDS